MRSPWKHQYTVITAEATHLEHPLNVAAKYGYRPILMINTTDHGSVATVTVILEADDQAVQVGEPENNHEAGQEAHAMRCLHCGAPWKSDRTRQPQTETLVLD